MSDSVLSAHYAPAVRERPAWRLFLLAAAAATLLPLALVPWAHRLAPDSESALRLLVVLNFIGANFHVATTGWFYTDAEMRPHFRAHPRRYLIVPGMRSSRGCPSTPPPSIRAAAPSIPIGRSGSCPSRMR